MWLHCKKKKKKNSIAIVKNSNFLLMFLNFFICYIIFVVWDVYQQDKL